MITSLRGLEGLFELGQDLRHQLNCRKVGMMGYSRIYIGESSSSVDGDDDRMIGYIDIGHVARRCCRRFGS